MAKVFLFCGCSFYSLCVVTIGVAMALGAVAIKSMVIEDRLCAKPNTEKEREKAREWIMKCRSHFFSYPKTVESYFRALDASLWCRYVCLRRRMFIIWVIGFLVVSGICLFAGF